MANLQQLIDETPAYNTLRVPDDGIAIDRTVSIRKPIHIEGGRIQEALPLSPMIAAESEDVSFHRVQLRGKEDLESWNRSPIDQTMIANAAIRIQGNSCEVASCKITGKSVAVRTYDCLNARIHHNDCVGLFSAMPSGGSNWHQLLSIEGDRHAITGNTLRQCGGAITAGDILTNTVIASNQIEDTYDNGVYISSGSSCTINSNTILRAHAGGGIKARGWLHSIMANTIEDIALVGIYITGIAKAMESPYPDLTIGGYGTACIGNTTKKCGAYGVAVDYQQGHMAYACTLRGNVIHEVAQASNPNTRYSGLRALGPGHIVDSNQIHYCHRESLAAIEAHNGRGTSISNNKALEVENGIYVRTSPRLQLGGNQMQARAKGVDILGCQGMLLCAPNDISGSWTIR